jgi:hypothetical protein
MANPYEWSDDRDAPRRDQTSEEDAHRAARRHAEQERMRPPGPRGGDYGAGGYGQDAAQDGYAAAGLYGRRSEQGADPGGFDRYERGDHRDDHRSFEAEAARVKQGIERGWRRFSHGVRQAFEEERGPAERDPRRGGGMFGGEDRSTSLFSHDDGLGGRRLGPHRGKGPTGYIRSDGRILDDISDRLSDDDRLDASDIEVKVEAGEVTLNGHVASREDKRRAEDLAESVSGVRHLQNNLRVRAPERPAEQSANPAATGGQNATAAAAAGTMGSAGGVAPEPNPRPN